MVALYPPLAAVVTWVFNSSCTRKNWGLNSTHYFEPSVFLFHSLMSLGNTHVLFNSTIPLEIIIASVTYFLPSSSLLVSMSIGSLGVYAVIMVT